MNKDETGLDQSQTEFVVQVSASRFQLVMRLCGLQKWLAGVPRVVFLARLADFGVDTFNVTEDQLQQETRLA